MKYFHHACYLLVLFLVNIECKSQCNNVTVNTDRFTDAILKNTIQPLTLENNRYKLVLNVKWHNTYYLIEGFVCDKTAPDYRLAFKNNRGNTKLSKQNIIYFLFEDGQKATYLNNSPNGDIYNNGLIDIPLMSQNYSSDIEEINRKILSQLMNSTVAAIRISTINDSDLDFDLKHDQKSFFCDALKCMETTKK